MIKRAFLFIAISYCLVNHLEVSAKPKRLLPKDARARVKARIDFECASRAAFTRGKLKKVVLRSLRHSENWGIVSGNIALPYDLNGDSIPEYFVPLQCSGNGNCDWGLFAIRPARLLGIIHGEGVYPRERVAGLWPAITTSGHLNASESMLNTFCFRNRQYQKCTRDYLISAYKRNGPKWYGTFSPLCDLNKRPFPSEK